MKNRNEKRELRNFKTIFTLWSMFLATPKKFEIMKRNLRDSENVLKH
jgi:hypothetical protein